MSPSPCHCGAVQITQWGIWTADGILHTRTECARRDRVITSTAVWTS